MNGTVVNYTEVYRLPPGAVFPIESWPPILLESTANGYDVHAVLNTIGSAVESELEWRWPPPYNGESRRAVVRIREKTRRYEIEVLQPLIDAVIDPSPLWHARAAFPGPR